MSSILKSHLKALTAIAKRSSTDDDLMKDFNELCDVVEDSLKLGGKILICGNGGSYCDAMHFAEELTGKYKEDRRALSAVVLGNPAHLTCVANDYSFEDVFAREVNALVRPGDVLICLSTSGKSKNVIKAAFCALAWHGVFVASLTGVNPSPLAEVSNLTINVPSTQTERIQELHQCILHALIDEIEHRVVWSEECT